MNPSHAAVKKTQAGATSKNHSIDQRNRQHWNLEKPFQLKEYLTSQDMEDFQTAGNYFLVFIIFSR